MSVRNLSLTVSLLLVGALIQPVIVAGRSPDDAISARFPFKSRYVEVLGSKMHYVEEGSGDPILLVHGNPTSSYIWRNIIPHLAILGRVIAVDLIGFGRSDKPDIEYRFSDHAKYLEGFIEKLSLRNITLVLHDWGMPLGFDYAMRHQANVKGIAFFEGLLTPLPPMDQWPPEHRAAFEAYRSPLGWDLLVNRNMFIEERLQQGIIRRLTCEEMSQYREPFREPASRKPIWRWTNELPVDGQPPDVAKIQKDYLGWLQKAGPPKLLLYAMPGVLIPQQVVDWARKNLKDIKAVYVGKGLHNIQEDLPMEISAALAEWIHLDLEGGRRPDSRFALLDGHKIHYETYGAGEEAVVFVHGAMSDLTYWRPQISAMEGKRVILVDLPGHGLSDKPKVEYRMDLYARAIDAVLSDAGVKHAVLVGHSMGTTVVRQFYRRYPEKTRGLVFVDGPLRPLAPTQEIGEKFLEPFRGPDYRKASENFFNTFIATPQTPDDLRKSILDKWFRTPRYVIVSVLEYALLPQSDPDVWKADKIDVPVLAIYTKMPYVPSDNEQFLHGLAADLEYQAWEGVGHNLTVEKSAEFNKVLREFLSRVGRGRHSARHKRGQDQPLHLGIHYLVTRGQLEE
jgi:haloalkane dehalogenase